MRFSSLFTSRWMALASAMMICLCALGFVGGWSNGASSLKQDDSSIQALNGAAPAIN